MHISSTLKTMFFASVAFTGLAGVLATNGLGSLLSSDAGKSQVVNQKEQPKSYIVQGKGSETLKTAVNSVGGSVSREFPIINAISAILTPSQAEVIAQLDDVRIQDDRSVATMSKHSSKKFSIDNYIATQVEADKLHEIGVTGRGVTVAVLDSGTNLKGQHGYNLFRNSYGHRRVFTKYNAIQGRRTRWLNDDRNGHGTHVSNIIASSLKSESGKANGIAPDVYLLSVKAFDKKGQSSYSKVLDGLNWIYHNQARYRIRVLNLSLGSEVRSNYWNDPINQAVMKLWEAGIVVITSAGNSGQNDMSITSPGNNPYIITVGAVTDSYTPFDFNDDRVTTFSSTGPTVEGFVKPEVVAYGGHVAAKLDNQYASGQFFENLKGQAYQEISGTSQASAVVSGIAALILQNDPSLSPDDVKCRIISSAKMAVAQNDQMAFSPFEQGHGMVNAYDAVTSTKTGCANRGLNIQDDIAGLTHYAGPARLADNGSFEIRFPSGLVMSEGTQWGDAGMFAEGTQWGDAGMFSEGTQWGDAGMFSEGTQWGDAGILAEGMRWGNAGMFAEGTQWGDAGIFAESWDSRETFSDAAAEATTASDSIIIVEEGEDEIEEWGVVEEDVPPVPAID
ncbi:MAG: serine protease AprX [Pseudomonadales bacterium]|jgi:serine protease AprX